MQCRTFSIPIDSDRALDKERTLNTFLETKNVKRIFASLATQPTGPAWSAMIFYEEGFPAAPKNPASTYHTLDAHAPAQETRPAQPSVTLTGAQGRMILALKKWRADQAAQEGVPLYMVAQNRWLEEIVQMPARTLDDLKRVKGLGDWRAQKYGSRILEIMNVGASGAYVS